MNFLFILFKCASAMKLHRAKSEQHLHLRNSSQRRHTAPGSLGAHFQRLRRTRSAPIHQLVEWDQKFNDGKNTCHQFQVDHIKEKLEDPTFRQKQPYDVQNLPGAFQYEKRIGSPSALGSVHQVSLHHHCQFAVKVTTHGPRNENGENARKDIQIAKELFQRFPNNFLNIYTFLEGEIIDPVLEDRAFVQKVDELFLRLNTEAPSDDETVLGSDDEFDDFDFDRDLSSESDEIDFESDFLGPSLEQKILDLEQRGIQIDRTTKHPQKGHWMVSELALGDLLQYISSPDFNKTDMLKFVDDCLDSLKLMHSLGYTHRDLHLGNTLIVKRDGEKKGIVHDFDRSLKDMKNAWSDYERFFRELIKECSVKENESLMQHIRKRYDEEKEAFERHTHYEKTLSKWREKSKA